VPISIRHKTPPQSVFWHERSPTRLLSKCLPISARVYKRKIWPRIKISRAHVTAGRVLRGYIKWLRVSALNPFKSPFMCSAVFSPLSVSRHLIKLALNYVVIGIDFAAALFFVRLLNTYRESAKKTKLTKTHARLFIPSPPPLLYIHNFLCRGLIASK
jgi:hypothetical protein